MERQDSLFCKPGKIYECHFWQRCSTGQLHRVHSWSCETNICRPINQRGKLKWTAEHYNCPYILTPPWLYKPWALCLVPQMSLLCLVQAVNKELYNFIWNGKDKVKRSTLINDIKHGGLKMLECMIKAQRIICLKKYIEGYVSPTYLSSGVS